MEKYKVGNKMIENNDKTFEIISEEEIDTYNDMTRNETIIPFSVLEDTLKILESLGCGYHNVKLVSYYSLSDKGFLLIAENGKFGIKLKDMKK